MRPAPEIDAAGTPRFARRSLAPAPLRSLLPREGWDPGKFGSALVLLLVLTLLTACGHKQAARVQVPPPPTIEQPETPPIAPGEIVVVPPDAKPIFTETGMASWYGPAFHNRRGANGEIYDMNESTAAHRTLPMNSVVRVTNIVTLHSTLVRITDRGPFVPDRIIDLSLAAAKAVDVWRPGTARVRLDVLQAPQPLANGGRWCVQIGGFVTEAAARRLQDKLARRYHAAKVLAFGSPTGAWWVRIRVADDDKHRAEALIHETKVDEGNVFLVRLD